MPFCVSPISGLRRKLPAAGLALVAAGCLAPAAANATYGGHNGRIAFNVREARGPDGQLCDNNCVYSIKPDGTGLRRVAVDADSPTFSPSGRIAYSGADGLFTSNADGTKARLVARDTYGSPVFSPDGRQLAYLDGTTMHVIDARSGAEQRSYELPWPSRDVYSWGSNGRFALAEDLADPNDCGDGEYMSDIYTVGSNGAGKKQLTTNLGSEQPDWSPDAHKIVFTRDTSVHAAGHGVTAADSNCKREASVFSTRKALEPVFGSSLHAAAAPQSPAAPAGSAIWVIGRDGRKARRITRGTADLQPAWSPDGRKVVFARFGSDTPSLYVMDANGKHQRRLVADGAFPAWQPRH